MQAVTDNEIREGVLRCLKHQPELSASDIDVAAEGGVVTLTGFVKRKAEKVAAESAAERVYGVKAVADALEIKAPRERTETEIAKDVLHSLRTNICVPADRINVIVAGGLVTLEGSVHSQFEKLMAEAAVKHLRGITGVFNNIEVKPEEFSAVKKLEIEHATGESAEAQDEAAILYELGLSADA